MLENLITFSDFVCKLSHQSLDLQELPPVYHKALFFKETTDTAEQFEPETSVRFHFAVTPAIWDKLTEHWSRAGIKPEIQRYREFIFDTANCDLIKQNCWFFHRCSSLEEYRKVKTFAVRDGNLFWKHIDNPEEIDNHIQSKLLHIGDTKLSSQLEWHNTRVFIDDGIWVDIAEWNITNYRQYIVGTMDLLKVGTLIGDILCNERVIPAPSKALAVAADNGGDLWDSWKEKSTVEEYFNENPLLTANNFSDFCSGKTIPTKRELLASWCETLDENLVPVTVNAKY